MKFSIVTVVINDLIGLEKTMQSIFIQSYKDYGWIVCDGGSDEKTIEFLESLDESVRWVSERDQGIYDAMNHGVSMSTGDYVVFMNAGDTFHDSDTLAKVAGKLSAEDCTVDVLFGGAMMSFASGRRMIYRPPKRAGNYLWKGLPANHQATYYRRDLLGVAPYDLQYRICGDYYLAAISIRKGARAVYLDVPLATFEVGGISYKNRKQLFAEPYRIQRDVLGMPFHYRLASMIKRFVSIACFVLLSQPIFQKKNDSCG